MFKDTQDTSRYIVPKILTVSWESKANIDCTCAELCRFQNSKRLWIDFSKMVEVEFYDFNITMSSSV